MGLLPKTAKITGEVLFTDRSGKQHSLLNANNLSELRGSEIAMIYQDSLSALNPSMRIKDQMAQLIKQMCIRDRCNLKLRYVLRPHQLFLLNLCKFLQILRVIQKSLRL